MGAPRFDLAHARGNRGAARIMVLDCGLSPHTPTRAAWNFTGANPDIGRDRHYLGSYHGDIMAATVRAVCPDAWVYYAKVLATGLTDVVAPIVAALRWAQACYVDAVSMSFTMFAGHQTYPTNLRDALADTLDQGIGVFAACGNDPANGANQPWPASFPGVVRCAWDQWIPPFATVTWPSGGGASSVSTAANAAAYGLWLASDRAGVRSRYLFSDPFPIYRDRVLPYLKDADGTPYCGGL